MSEIRSTTTFSIPGYRVVRCHGLVRGLVVRSRNLAGNIVAGLQTIFGGNITYLTELCEHARGEAYDIMLKNAQALGGNAVLGVRYSSSEPMEGCSEVLAYGTAVEIVPE